MTNEIRNRIIDELNELRQKVEHSTPDPDIVYVPKELFYRLISGYQRLLKALQWRKFELRDPDEDEKVSYSDWLYVVTNCPDDGDEILVSDGKYIWKDEFYIDDCCHLDSDRELEDCWWMPLPPLPEELKEGDRE